MPILPENKLMEKDITPKVFFIWGQSMHGKTYLAKQFPNPIILNTDGNGKKIDTPHIDILDFETFVEALKEIEEGKHSYETIVVDLIDDIKTFMEDYICKKYNVETLADAGFGKGFSDAKSIWKRLMIRLSQLPYTVVFISHIIQATDEYDKNTTIEQPSLEQKYLNMTKGRTDVMIKCQKIGKNYFQFCNEKRDLYKREDFKNQKILDVLKNVKQLFEDNKPVIQEVSSADTTSKKVEVVKTETVPMEKSDELLSISPNVTQIAKKSLLIKKEEE